MSNAEAPFSYTAKIHGELFTVRGDDAESFLNNLAWAATNIGQIVEATNLISATSITNEVMHRVPIQATATGVAAASNAWAQPAAPAAPPAFTQASVPAPTCNHGPRTAKSGVGPKGPWRAWFCPAPKGDPTQCEAQWVRQGQPEWATFPA